MSLQMYDVLIINIGISLVGFLYWKMRRREESSIRLLIMILLPFVGILTFIVVDIMNDNSKNEKINLDELVEGFEIEESFFLKGIDAQKEMNVVPVEDALAMNDNSIKRKLIIDALKEDSYEYCSFLKEALNDKDTETSHYAAAAVVEMKRELTTTIQELANRYEKNPTDLDVAKEYADMIDKFIKTGLLDKKTNHKYLKMYFDVLAYIIKLNCTDLKALEEKVNCDIQLGEYNKAIMYCNLFRKVDKTNAKPYVLLLKIYYQLKNREKFNEVLEILKKSKARIDRNELGNIRFWLRSEI